MSSEHKVTFLGNQSLSEPVSSSGKWACNSLSLKGLLGGFSETRQGERSAQGLAGGRYLINVGDYYVLAFEKVLRGKEFRGPFPPSSFPPGPEPALQIG